MKRPSEKIGILQRFWHLVPQAVQDDAVMAMNRLTAGSLMLLATALAGKEMSLQEWTNPILLWLFCATILAVHIRIVPRPSIFRRVSAIALDVFGTSVLLNAGGEATAFLYTIYLWIIIGNGFRFGGTYLIGASLASTTGFIVVILGDTFWHTYLSLSLGLMSGLVFLPAYAFALIRRLAQARKQAELADQAKSMFLASISHELRTPLNAIIGTTELLQRTRLNADQAEMVATIDSAASGQLGLVQDVLEFSRIEAGHRQTEITSFDLAELLNAVKNVVSVEARTKGLLVSTHVTARTPARLLGDERHLREVLLNLCGNAVKFTLAGSVTLAADGVEGSDGSVRLRLEVMDTGIGIAPDAQGRIFELFTQADATILNRFGGTGLGLALCERQVRLMAGTMGVKSAPAVGSTFWVELVLARDRFDEAPPVAVPLATVPSQGAWADAMKQKLNTFSDTKDEAANIVWVQEGYSKPVPVDAGAAILVLQEPLEGLPSRSVRERFAATVSEHSSAEDWRRAVRIAAMQSRPAMHATVPSGAEAWAAAPEAFANIRVLVADDNKTNRIVTAKMLERAGMTVTFAVDGEQALAILSEGEVDIGLLDVNMPVMDGIAAAQLYGFSIPDGHPIPLIALTADASPDTRERCLSAGIKACLLKPIRSEALLDAIRDALDCNPPTPRPSAQIASPILDTLVLERLESLGGVPFVEQLVEEFKQDGSLVLPRLETAIVLGDVHRFRFEAHSLSSIASNIGAVAVWELCTSWQRLPEGQLHDGPGLMAGLRERWADTCDELDQHVRTITNLPCSVGDGQVSPVWLPR